jgi:hypothetical protein
MVEMEMYQTFILLLQVFHHHLIFVQTAAVVEALKFLVLMETQEILADLVEVVEEISQVDRGIVQLLTHHHKDILVVVQELDLPAVVVVEQDLLGMG